MIRYLDFRFPEKQNIVSLFATAVFIVYGWTIYSSFWKVPSWINYLKLSEILSVYAYSFLWNFAESLFLTLGLILLGYFLSTTLWKDGFLAASVLMLVLCVGSALLHLKIYEDPTQRVDFIRSQKDWWLVTLPVALIASFLILRIGPLRRFLEGLADRFTVFLYIYIPLTVLALGVVIVRIAL